MTSEAPARIAHHETPRTLQIVGFLYFWKKSLSASLRSS